MLNDVKITMNDYIDKFLGLLAPHICKACQTTGATLCECCIINITKQKFPACVVCGHLITSKKRGNLCNICVKSLPFDRIYAVGWRQPALRQLVGDYKYFSQRSSAPVIAKLLDQTLPKLTNNVVIVPVPTIRKHIRQRGFDHNLLVGRQLAKIRHLSLNRWLIRQDNSVQHQASLIQRQFQAERAFMVKSGLALPDTVLLLDDIWTTGATLSAAAKLLKKHGVKTVIGAIVAVQPKS
jgi:ComF family protein